MQRAWDHLGRAVFRWRSVLPLPVIYAVLSLSWDSHLSAGPGGPTVDAALDVAGILVCFAGWGWRLVTVASVPAGSSTQTRAMKANALNRTGMYAVVRHPLYLGNFAITLGLLLIANEPWAYGLGLGYWWFTHALIVRNEERLLASAFEGEWHGWAQTTHRWWPALNRLGQVRGPFAWKRALQREVNPLVAWGCGATLLILWERFVRSSLTGPQGKRLLGTVLALLVLLAMNKVWKKVSPA